MAEPKRTTPRKPRPSPRKTPVREGFPIPEPSIATYRVQNRGAGQLKWDDEINESGENSHTWSQVVAILSDSESEFDVNPILEFRIQRRSENA
jgi:hypothetical protein